MMESQMQRLKNAKLKDALEEIKILWDNPSDILSQLIRTAFIPRPGHKFLVADFSAIEARVISWLAKEEWRLEVFRTHGMIYEASASKMFKIAMELITKDSPYRQKGKISELALGYQGAVNALITMGALNDPNIKKEIADETIRVIAAREALKQKQISMGQKISIDKRRPEDVAAINVLMPLVKAWRQQNPKIVDMWYRVQDAAIDAVKSRETTTTHGLTFYMKENVLFIGLHSGRALAYWNAEVRENSHGEYLSYEGLDQKRGLWCRIDTYGGKLVENIVQAEARDCLAWAIKKFHKRKLAMPMHVHDEVVIEVPEDSKITLEEVCAVMAEPIPWARGLPLAAEGFTGYYYKK